MPRYGMKGSRMNRRKRLWASGGSLARLYVQHTEECSCIATTQDLSSWTNTYFIKPHNRQSIYPTYYPQSTSNAFTQLL